MPTKGTSVKGIRLQDAAWAEIDSQAEAFNMSRSEWFRRRIESWFRRVSEVPNPDEKSDNPDALLELKKP